MHKQDWVVYKKNILANLKRVVIKIGSAVLTNDSGLDLKVITRLADDISSLHERKIDVVLVSSGAVAAGLKKLSFQSKKFNLIQKQALSAIGQSRLMYVYDKTFANFSKITAQVLLTRQDLCSRERFLNARNTLHQLLRWQVIPIVNENDTVAIQELTFGDNDQLAVMVLNLVEADLLLNLTSAQGVFDKNPLQFPQAKRLRVIEDILALDLDKLCQGKTETGTGGMYSKLLAAKRAAQLGVPTVILPGKERFVLERLFQGEDLGTWILPQGKKVSRRKFWLAYNLEPEGQIWIDSGAVTALKKGKSLLPVGIKKIKGSFQRGSLVKIADEKDNVIGAGLCNYNSQEVEQIKGKHSSEIDAVRFPWQEVIHADNLLLDVFF